MPMLLATHVMIALGSIGYSSYLLISPVSERFKYAYILIASTLVSGTVLVISAGSNMLKSCMTGIGYLVVVSACLFIARYRLSAAKQKTDSDL